MIGLIRKIIKYYRLKREFPCEGCANLKCVSNFSPCYQCRNRDKWEPNKIYVAIFNHFGDLSGLAADLGATVVENTLCFTGLDGQTISDIMEQNGLDYNYGWTPEEAWEVDE